MISRRLITLLLPLAAAVGIATLVAGAFTAGAAAAQEPTATPLPTPLPRAYVIKTDAYVLPYARWANLTLETREGNGHEATVSQ